MPVDFTVVMAVRQRFGDQIQDKSVSGSEPESGLFEERHAPFVGVEKDFPFQCPNVDGSQFAILLFQSIGVTRKAILEINGQTIFGGIPESVEFNTRDGIDGPIRQSIARWIGNVMLVHPGVLRANNVLRIRALEAHGPGSNIDDFIIDNIVVVFKTTGRGGVLGVGGFDATARSKRSTKKSVPKKAAKRRR